MTVLIYFFSLLYANGTKIHENDVSLLKESHVYIANPDTSLNDILEQKLFKPYSEEYINISNEKKVVWIKLELSNTSSEPLDKILLFSSTFIEHIYLYDEKNLSKPITRGQSHFEHQQNTLLPYFPIKLNANSTQTYYLKVYSVYTPVLFKLTLTDEDAYLKKDKVEQATDIFLIGFIFALMLYSLVIALYLKDKSYFFYSSYLFVLLYDQMRYLGLTQIYFSSAFMQFDMDITITRIFLLSLTSSLFIIYFLKLHLYPKLHMLYRFIIIFCIVCIIFLHDSIDYGISIVMVLSFLVIVLHFFVGIYTYSKGQKQARLYLIGFGVVFFFYLLIISDSIGLTVLLQEYHNALLFATTFEALVLSLAFADRYNILQKEKKDVVSRYLTESQNRENIIESEVKMKTKQLNNAVEAKELLLQEVHHRVKNNLYIILSMIQLQQNNKNNKQEESLLIDLENRINAIAKTYDMLIVSEDLQHIDMKPYIEHLLDDIQESFTHLKYNIDFHTEIHATLPLKEAVYVGLIINEAITNSYKYAFETEKGTIHVSLIEKNKEYILNIKDSGVGFKNNKEHSSLGMKLIQTLAKEQLYGTFNLESTGHTHYKIVFDLI